MNTNSWTPQKKNLACLLEISFPTSIYHSGKYIDCFSIETPGCEPAVGPACGQSLKTVVPRTEADKNPKSFKLRGVTG